MVARGEWVRRSTVIVVAHSSCDMHPRVASLAAYCALQGIVQYAPARLWGARGKGGREHASNDGLPTQDVDAASLQA
jgi:dienelactone hydrolase